MRIAIDARELAGQATGVGRYLSEILREWNGMAAAAEHEFILCAPSEIDPGRWPELNLTTDVEGGSGTSWEQRVLPRLVRRASADLLFCPAYTAPVFDATPLVVTIHDVSFAAHPEWFRWREGLRRRVITRAAARRARRVLTVSGFSRREIVERLGVPPSKVTVVYSGVGLRSADCGPPAAGRGSRTDPLLLYVGSIFNRRHVPETIRAFKRLARRRPEARFAIVGDNRTHPYAPLEPLVSDSPAIALNAYVADDVLADLYRRARALVFLSEYEGFGLPPLEALAAGVPIVVLDTAVAREIYGDAAIYVPDPDPRVIEPALERALFVEAERRRVLDAAPAVLARYSWTACAAAVLQALVEAGA
jgi:glycosyltransferase involved in cell wall biosynthesis